MKVKVSEIAVLNANLKKYRGLFSTIKYLDTGSVEQGKIYGFQEFDLSCDKIPSRAQRAVKDKTIVISSVRPNQLHYAILNKPDDNLVVSSGFVTVDAIPECVDAQFLYYALTSEQATKYLDSIASTAVSSYPSFNPEDLGNYVLDIPNSIDEQKKIANVFASIDERIENNSAICSDLEAMAKLLYDYWFVQFDFPDENGNPYKSSGGKMVWSEELNREIPAGWQVNTLSACVAKSKNGDWGNASPKKPNDIEVRCFRGADFPSITNEYRVTAPIRYISASRADRLLSAGDLIVEISGGSPVQSTGRIGYVNPKFLERNGNAMDCSNFCKAFTPMNRNYQFWLYQTWQLLYDAGVMFNYESKTTGIKNLMFDEFVNWTNVVVPSDDLLNRYQDICDDLYGKIQESFIESAELASLRDFLLPMLMNGQVQVGDVS